MKVFITGGTGTVGSACITSLVRGQQHSVRGLARSATSASKITDLGATAVQGDITDTALLEREASLADAVIYCAFDHASTNWGSEAQTETAAVTAICKALSTSSPSGNKILMYCSGVTGFPPPPDLATEQTPLNKMSYRGPTDTIVEQYSTTNPPEGNGIRGIQIRLAMVVHTHWKPHGFLHMLHKGDHVTYYKDGSNKWPAADALDVGDLIALVLDQEDKIPKAKVSAIHAYTEQVSTKDVADTLAQDKGLEVRPFGDADLEKMEMLQKRILTASPGVSNTWTRETFGWQPKGKTLLQAIKENNYFAST